MFNIILKLRQSTALYIHFCLLLVLILSVPISGQAQDYLAAYQNLLHDYVRKGERHGITSTLVKYSAWGQDPRHMQAISNLLAVKPSRLKGDQLKAYWINAYNLLTIDLIIKTGEKESIRNQGSLFRNVWKSFFWRIEGKDYSLDEIEHGILRKLGDARIHFAINCASMSCPDLLSVPFEAKNLNKQLESLTRAFILNNQKGMRMQNGNAEVSKIFDWFEKDFGGKSGVLALINTHLPGNIEIKSINGYLDYDWSLNWR